MKPEDVKDLDGAADRATGQMQDLRKAVDDLLKQAALDAAQASKQKDIFFMADMLDGIKGLFEEVYNTIAPQWIEALKEAQLPSLAKLSEKEIKDLTPYLFTALADYCRRNYIDDENLTISEIAGQTDPETGKTVIELAISEAREALARQKPETITPDKEIFTEIIKRPYFLTSANQMSNMLSLYETKIDDYNKTRLEFEYKGNKLNAKKVKALGNSLPISVLKLWDMATGTLLKDNKYKAKDPQLWITIPLEYYAEIRGRSITPKEADTPEAQAIENKRAKDRLKDFRKSIKKDMETLEDLRINIAQTGEKAGNFIPIPYILNDSRIWNDVIMIHFPKETAANILTGHLMQYPVKLQAIEGRNPNPYRLGRAMYDHASSDNNIRRNIANTLSVKSLLDDCPDIETLEQLKSRKTDKGRKNSDESRKWKTLIKGKLEQSLKVLKEGGVLLKWTYRDAKTARTYSAEKAEAMDYITWQNLRIDYELIPADSTEALAQDKRRKRNANKAAEARKKKDEKAELTSLAKQAVKAAMDEKKAAEAKKGGGR